MPPPRRSRQAPAESSPEQPKNDDTEAPTTKKTRRRSVMSQNPAPSFQNAENEQAEPSSNDNQAAIKPRRRSTAVRSNSPVQNSAEGEEGNVEASEASIKPRRRSMVSKSDSPSKNDGENSENSGYEQNPQPVANKPRRRSMMAREPDQQNADAPAVNKPRRRSMISRSDSPTKSDGKNSGDEQKSENERSQPPNKPRRRSMISKDLDQQNADAAAASKPRQSARRRSRSPVQNEDNAAKKAEEGEPKAEKEENADAPPNKPRRRSVIKKSDAENPDNSSDEQKSQNEQSQPPNKPRRRSMIAKVQNEDDAAKKANEDEPKAEKEENAGAPPNKPRRRSMIQKSDAENPENSGDEQKSQNEQSQPPNKPRRRSMIVEAQNEDDAAKKANEEEPKAEKEENVFADQPEEQTIVMPKRSQRRSLQQIQADIENDDTKKTEKDSNPEDPQQAPPDTEQQPPPPSISPVRKQRRSLTMSNPEKKRASIRRSIMSTIKLETMQEEPEEEEESVLGQNPGNNEPTSIIPRISVKTPELIKPTDDKAPEPEKKIESVFEPQIPDESLEKDPSDVKVPEPEIEIEPEKEVEPVIAPQITDEFLEQEVSYEKASEPEIEIEPEKEIEPDKEIEPFIAPQIPDESSGQDEEFKTAIVPQIPVEIDQAEPISAKSEAEHKEIEAMEEGQNLDKNLFVEQQEEEQIAPSPQVIADIEPTEEYKSSEEIDAHVLDEPELPLAESVEQNAEDSLDFLFTDTFNGAIDPINQEDIERLKTIEESELENEPFGFDIDPSQKVGSSTERRDSRVNMSDIVNLPVVSEFDSKEKSAISSGVGRDRKSLERIEDYDSEAADAPWFSDGEQSVSSYQTGEETHKNTRQNELSEEYRSDVEEDDGHGMNTSDYDGDGSPIKSNQNKNRTIIFPPDQPKSNEHAVVREYAKNPAAIRNLTRSILYGEIDDPTQQELIDCIEVISTDLDDITELCAEKEAEAEHNPNDMRIEYQRVDYSSKKQIFEQEFQILNRKLVIALCDDPVQIHAEMNQIYSHEQEIQMLIRATAQRLLDVEDRFGKYGP